MGTYRLVGQELYGKRIMPWKLRRLKQQAFENKLPNLSAIKAYDVIDTYQGSNVKIGVINSGGDVFHPEIADRFEEPLERKGVNMVNPSENLEKLGRESSRQRPTRNSSFVA